MNNLIELEQSLKELIDTTDLNNKSFVWIGIAVNEKARKYKYEVYWFNSEEHLGDYNLHKFDIDSDSIIHSCDSKICESIRQAYSNAFYQVKVFLDEYPNSLVSIKDFIEIEDDE